MQMKYATRDIYMYLPTHLDADYQTKLSFVLHKDERKRGWEGGGGEGERAAYYNR